jgi:hypothetical protein
LMVLLWAHSEDLTRVGVLKEPGKTQGQYLSDWEIAAWELKKHVVKR